MSQYQDETLQVIKALSEQARFAELYRELFKELDGGSVIVTHEDAIVEVRRLKQENDQLKKATDNYNKLLSDWAYRFIKGA
ncbi:MAG: hypothetical protein WBI20_14925 [Burkholderiaceae bacterium]